MGEHRIGEHLVHFIADYGPGDLAMSEVTDALYDHLPEGYQLHTTSVPSFKTTTTGFVVAQLGLKPRRNNAPRRIIYANCAPRRDTLSSRRDNEGEGLVYGVLNNGVELVVVNSKFTLSFVKNDLKELYQVKVSNSGSQFRSRDNYPEIVGAVAAGTIQEYLGVALDPKQVIPDTEEGFVAYIDSFGNIKTTFRTDGDTVQELLASEGEQEELLVNVTCNGETRPAYVSTSSFSVPEGALTFSKGSSGWKNRFWELFLRGGEASALFKNPGFGAEIRIDRIGE